MTRIFLFLVCAAALLTSGWYFTSSSTEENSQTLQIDSEVLDESVLQGDTVSSIPGIGSMELPLFLHGTVNTGNSDTSVAMISSDNNEKIVTYHVGDELPGGGMLYLIDSRSVQVLTDTAIIEIQLGSPPGSVQLATQEISVKDSGIANAIENMLAHDVEQRVPEVPDHEVFEQPKYLTPEEEAQRRYLDQMTEVALDD
ncbi:MAG: hypothetical protein AAFN50_10770 [Pseudomonadota bacterium]